MSQENPTSPSNGSPAKMTEKHDNTALTQLYTDGDSVDQEVFAEMRSNLLLVGGEHYNRRQSSFYRRIRDSRELSQEQKLRLTKNHIQKICKTYVNQILSAAPGVGFEPKEEANLQNQKATELNHSTWQDAVERYDITDKIDDWGDNFVEVGEVAVKLFFDPNAGPISAYNQAVSEEGEPMMDENGEPMPDMDSPVYAGEFVFEEIYGFNLLRPPECKDMRKASWLCIRKMVDKDELLARFGEDDEKSKFIVASADDTFLVFDGARGGYRKATNQVLIREFFFRPQPLYPRGYFYITSKEGILDEGELPGGLFPIVFMPFDKIQTTPRGRSPIKYLRPYQAEINRSASKIAEHQITLGDDKLLLQNGTKVSAGASLPGVRAVNYTGQKPEVLPGRNGAQYLEYMNSQIKEMYEVANVMEQEVDTAQADPWMMLFKSASQKKKFMRYIKRFEKFLTDICKLYLRLAKIHFNDDQIIHAIGKMEQINIAEFKKTDDVCFDINVVSQADDVETKFGKQLSIQHALQYVGSQLKPEDIAKLLRQMPWANFEADFDEMTVDYDSIRNDLLALDRGEQPPVHPYDNHVYVIKRLTNRMRAPDFQFLPPATQHNYAMKVQLHEKLQAQQLQQMQRMQQGFIPTDGYMVGCDFYVNNPDDPNKTRRVRVPYQALNWLINQLASQGTPLQELESMNQGNQQEIAGMMSGPGGPPHGAPPPGSQPGGPRPPVTTQAQVSHPAAGMPMGGMPKPPMGPRPGMAPMGQPQRPPMPMGAGMPPRPMMPQPGMAGAMNGIARPGIPR